MRSRSLHKLQHASLHQLQQERHRVVFARKVQAELCKLGVCLQQSLHEECSKFTSHLHVRRWGRRAIAMEYGSVNNLLVIVKQITKFDGRRAECFWSGVSSFALALACTTR